MVLPLPLQQGLRPVLPLPPNCHQGPLSGQLATQSTHAFLFLLDT